MVESMSDEEVLTLCALLDLLELESGEVTPHD